MTPQNKDNVRKFDWGLSFSNLVLGLVTSVFIVEAMNEIELRGAFIFMALMGFAVFLYINFSAQKTTNMRRKNENNNKSRY